MVSAALAALLATAAWAAPVKGPVPCARAAAAQEPPTLDALLDCQAAALAQARDRYRARRKKDPPERTVDLWQERQRAEVRDYLARHPERAQTSPPAPAGEEEQQDLAEDGEDKELAALRRRAWAASDGGRLGVTPETARQMTDYLKKRQGGRISPEMQDLLDAVQRDGGKLSDATVLKLKHAARRAKSAGLDLGVSPKVEDFLLNDDQAPERPVNLN